MSVCCCLVNNLFHSIPPFCQKKRGSKARRVEGLPVRQDSRIHQQDPLGELSRSELVWPVQDCEAALGLPLQRQLWTLLSAAASRAALYQFLPHLPSILPGCSAMNNGPGFLQGQVIGLERQQLPCQQPGRLRLLFGLGEGHAVCQEKPIPLMTTSCHWAAAPHSVC